MDHKVANVQQVAQSQRNKDLQVGNVMKSQNELMAKIKLNPGGRVRRRELLEWIYFQFDKEAEVEEDDDEGEGEYDDDYDDDEGNR